MTLTDNSVAIILGRQWQNEEADIKAQFKSLAEKIKKDHQSAYPNYQYQPRKPAEKKRRMTRGKAEKMDAQAKSSNSSTGAAAVPAFGKSSTGNAVFTLGDDSIEDDATLMAMVQKHNQDVMALTAHPVESAAPVLFHEHSEEAHNDASFYGNLLDFDEMFPNPFPPPHELFPLDQALLDKVMNMDEPTREAVYEAKVKEHEYTEVIRQLSLFSNLWSPSLPDQETPSSGDMI